MNIQKKIPLFSEHTNKDIKHTLVKRSCQTSQLQRITDTTYRMLDRSDPYTIDKLVSQRMKLKRRRSKPYPQAVLDMVEDFQPGAKEYDDYEMEEAEDVFGDDLDYVELDDDEAEYLEVTPDLESFQLLEELDGVPDDERGLGDELTEFLNN